MEPLGPLTTVTVTERPAARARLAGMVAALFLAAVVAIMGVGSVAAASPNAVPSAAASASTGDGSTGDGSREDCPEKAADASSAAGAETSS